MTKTEQVHEFDCEIYPRKLWVTVGVPYAVIKDMFEDVEPMDDAPRTRKLTTHED